MPVIKGVVICNMNGTNPPRRRKGDPLPQKLNPLAPDFVPKNLELTPPSCGKPAFAGPDLMLVRQQHPPHMGPCPYQGLQKPYQGLQGVYIHHGHNRQVSGESSVSSAPDSYQGPYVAYQPPAATFTYEPHMSFGRNIYQEVMAELNNPHPPRHFVYQAPAY
ncbi:hypothetical protein QBC45DRAFT_361865 [Copromyces sp. CBS 386.78]|nr:hypothetical protein QBC45DRAFT_361865 [Copromyces sp. CBS 386.78]